MNGDNGNTITLESSRVLNSDAGVVAFESTTGSRHNIVEGARYVTEVKSGIAVCPDGKPPGCADEWTWQNVATVGLFMVCLAYILGALFKAIR